MATPYPTGAPSAPPPSSGEFKTQVQLLISCTNLVDKDILSKSDPICVVDMLQGTIDASRGKFTEVGRTEHIKDNLNPSFTKAITVDFFFEEIQHLHFIVYDVDKPGQNLRAGGGELLGEAKTQLGKIVAAGSLELTLEVAGKKKSSSKIKIVAEEVSNIEEKISVTWAATKLDKKDFFGKSDPFLEFSRANPDGTFTPVHRTEIIKNSLNPSWQPFSLSSRQLCNSDDSRQIRIQCHDWDSDGSTDYIGSCMTSLAQLRQGRLPLNLELVNEEKAKKKKSYRNSGVAHLQALKFQRSYSFLDYISHGCELNFVVGVDFTGSNGDPRKSNSLHYLPPGGGAMNEYQRALWAVGSICEQYDTDKLFPAFGFGAKVPPEYKFSNIFNLSVGSPRPECQGVGGILAAYQSAITQVQLWGPTNAAPIITAVCDFAEGEHKRIVSQKLPCKSYQILLLLTDGILTDMEQTKMAVIRGSHLPMSVIIVGVGAADFSDMEALDADDGLLTCRGKSAARDIVQFVPFSQYRTRPPEHLAKDVLAEVPTQLVQYMALHEFPIGSPTAAAATAPRQP
ncbi:copine-1-like [Sycon ciliatum]|uniref:copine-1-like n=1 Tax=Sycon ciliatum TaxID=27933 RepID=UPI0031F63B6D